MAEVAVVLPNPSQPLVTLSISKHTTEQTEPIDTICGNIHFNSQYNPYSIVLTIQLGYTHCKVKW